jgi:transcriptional regulator with XRE-family HTH domain
MPVAMYDFSIVRDLRQREGLTIADLSQRSGISSAVISKLERNQSAAELATLFSISRAFGINTTDLLLLAESRTAHRKHESSHKSGSFTFREITYSNVRALIGEASAGGKVSNPEIHSDDYEICWVLEGQVRIILPHEQHDLKAGQCVQFDAILEHTYEVVENCRVLILHQKKAKRF